MQSMRRCSVAHNGHHHYGDLSEDSQSLTFGRTDGHSITWFRLSDGDASASMEDLPGPYRVVHAGAAVTEGFARGSRDVATLSRGIVVDVLEVRVAASEERIRGLIASPAGWISLLKTNTGERWADRIADEVGPFGDWVVIFDGDVRVRAGMDVSAEVLRRHPERFSTSRPGHPLRNYAIS